MQPPTPANGASTLTADDAPDVVAVLAESFFDYPVMRFILGSDDDYGRRLATLITFFVQARVLRDETLLGVRRSAVASSSGASAGGLAAAALVSRPGGAASPESLDALREQTWATLGADARSRYEAFGEAAGRFTVEDDHHHLNMIGVRPAHQGRGLGRHLLEAVHDRSASDPASTGVSLTTEDASNVPLYRRFGYRVLGSADVVPGLTTWAMFRPDG